jgi:Raf kinase inhibitor-like YbhB/YbcL family protein
MSLKLTSTAFEEGEAIPERYTCDGADLSPPLAWSGVPAGARSLVLLCSDPDAPGGTWWHWAIYNLRPEVTELREGATDDPQVGGIRQAVNDFRRTGYGGPCPPAGHGAHRYRFSLLALNVEQLQLPDNAHCRDVARAAQPRVVAEAVLTGRYARE